MINSKLCHPPKSVSGLSTDQIVEELTKFGIKIVWKPVAIIQISNSSNNNIIWEEEKDVYDVLQQNYNRSSICNR